MKRFLLTVLLLSIVAIWGWTFSVVKDAVAVYGVISFLAIRFAIGAALLAFLPHHMSPDDLSLSEV